MHAQEAAPSAQGTPSPPLPAAEAGAVGLKPIQTGRRLRFARLLSSGTSVEGASEPRSSAPSASLLSQVDMSEEAAARRAAMAAVLLEPAPPRCFLGPFACVCVLVQVAVHIAVGFSSLLLDNLCPDHFHRTCWTWTCSTAVRRSVQRMLEMGANTCPPNIYQP